MLTKDELEALPRAKVMSYAANLGMGTPFNEKKADLINRVVMVQSSAIEPKKPEPEKIVVVQAVEKPDQEEVRKALQSFVDRGMVLTFPDENSFQIEYKAKRDSGTLHQPLKSIVRVAEYICRQST